MICSKNSTFLMPQLYQIYINAVASGCIAFSAIFGNLLIIIIFIKFKQLRNVNNAAITLLASSDFSRGVVVMTTKIVNQVRFAGSTVRPELEEPSCSLTAVVCGFTFVFSPMVLAFIAVLRYFVISPQNIGAEVISKTKFIFCVSVMFLVAAIFATLPLMGISGMGKYRYSQSHGVCFADWCDDNRAFRTIFYVVVIGIAWPVLTIFYVTLFIAFRRYNKGFIQVLEESSAGSRGRLLTIAPSSSSWVKSYDDCDTDGLVTNDYSQNYDDELLNNYDEQQGIPRNSDPDDAALLHNSIYDRIARQESQITRVMLVIFLAYCICWFPAAVVNVIAISDMERIPIEWFYIIVTMVELKCAVDPIIYGLGNSNYRKALQQIFGCYC